MASAVLACCVTTRRDNKHHPSLRIGFVCTLSRGPKSTPFPPRGSDPVWNGVAGDERSEDPERRESRQEISPVFRKRLFRPPLPRMIIPWPKDSPDQSRVQSGQLTP